MKLSAWIWLTFGAIIAGVSAYVYWFVPKDGKPNTAMALFFFIGGVFIIIGIIKLFFRRLDAGKSVVDSMQTVEEPKIVQMSQQEQIVQQPINRVEQTVQDMAKQEQSQQKPSQPPHQPARHPQHTNSYYRTHEYKKPTPISGQAPVSQAASQTAAQHSIRCKKCSTVNVGTAHYCHTCGNRLV